MNAGMCVGGVRSLSDLKDRCVIGKGNDGCWHLRKADGKPYPDDGKTMRVWCYERGCAMSAARLAFELYRRRKLDPGRVAYRTCDSHDCIRPKHRREGTRIEAGAYLTTTGRLMTMARRSTAVLAGKSKAKLTGELRIWLLESTQSGVEAAHGLGIAQSRASALRVEASRRHALLPVASVFHIGARVELAMAA